MVILIAGASHTGKTLFAQRLLEKTGYPYLSEDHLKMGLIRSGATSLTPLSSDKKLTEYLWPIVKEMIKTAIENNQNLIVEGCYIPFDWKKDFSEEYLENIKYRCIIMTEEYIKAHSEEIKGFACVIEARIDDYINLPELIRDNKNALALVKKYNSSYILIDEDYASAIKKGISEL